MLDAKTGRFIAYGATPADDARHSGTIGGGHSGLRVLPVAGRWWFPNISGVYGNVDPAAPTDEQSYDRAVKRLLEKHGVTTGKDSNFHC